MSSRLKREEEVVVIAGDHKGSRGKLLEIFKNKKGQLRVRVSGVNVRERLQRSKEHPKGQRVPVEMSLHYSNVMRSSTYDKRQGKKDSLQTEKANSKA